MTYVALFFAGAFLCNCIPHLASGLMGRPFPTPFARPRGVGDSPPVVNFLWGALNFVAGLWLLRSHPVAVEPGLPFLVVIVGALLAGVYLSVHFGRVWRDKHGK